MLYAWVILGKEFRDVVNLYCACIPYTSMLLICVFALASNATTEEHK